MDQDTNHANTQAPLYNIKAAAHLTGLLPVTLRAWERRYGVPSPRRTDQGYRLYTEQDVQLVRWLKIKVDAGLSIGHAVEYLTRLKDAGQNPAAEPQPALDGPNSPDRLSQELVLRLRQFDESLASGTLQRAFALFSPEAVLQEVMKPALVEIGEAWRRGEIPVATEHFASAFFTRHLLGMFAAAGAPWRAGVILAACLPGETHEIGLLTVSVLLRWRGWNVKYRGQDLSLERLDEVLQALNPQMILFSATLPENTRSLPALTALLGGLRHTPLVVFGGQGFDTTDPASLPGILLSGNTGEYLTEIEKRLKVGSNNGGF